MAKYRCRECHAIDVLPRPYRFHFGKRCRCHRCGTYRITKLKMRDKIDPMEPGFLNLMERLLGGNLYHCRFCRLQFWDRRRFVPAPPANKTAAAKTADAAKKNVAPSNAPAAAKESVTP